MTQSDSLLRDVREVACRIRAGEYHPITYPPTARVLYYALPDQPKADDVQGKCARMIACRQVAGECQEAANV